MDALEIVISCVCGMLKKKKGTNESICKTQIESQNKPMITKGEMDGRDKLGDWD